MDFSTKLGYCHLVPHPLGANFNITKKRKKEKKKLYTGLKEILKKNYMKIYESSYFIS